jgi:hypothetical protein
LETTAGRLGNTLDHTGIGNNFLNRTSMAQQLRERIDKWDYIKLKNFCIAKETVLRPQTEEATYRMGENLCQLYI